MAKPEGESSGLLQELQNLEKELTGKEPVQSSETDHAEEVEPVVVEEENTGGVDQEAQEAEATEETAQVQATRQPVKHGLPEDRDTVPLTQANLEKLSTNQRSRIAEVFADPALSTEDIRQILESPFEKSLTGGFKYKDKDLDYFVSAEEIQALVDVITAARQQNENLRGIGINKLLTSTNLEKIKPLFSDPVVLATMLQEYAFITADEVSSEEEQRINGVADAAVNSAEEPEQEVVQPEVNIERPVADLAEELAQDLEPEEDEETVEVTEEDMQQAEKSGATMAPDTEGEEIVIEESDLPAPETEERTEVTIEQFLQLARTEKYNPALFYSKFLNNEENMKQVAEFLQQYSNSEITAAELQAAIVKYAVELQGMTTRVGTQEANKPELLAEFFDELLGVEAEQKDDKKATPLLSGTGGTNLLPALGKIVSKLVPKRIWGKEKSVDEMDALELAKKFGPEKAKEILKQRKAKKAEQPAAAPEEDQKKGQEGELIKPGDPEFPEVEWQPLEGAESTEEPKKEPQPEAESESEPPQTEETEKKKVEIPKEMQERVREMLQAKEYAQLKQYFFDRMSEAADTDLYEPLSEAFKAVSTFIKSQEK